MEENDQALTHEVVPPAKVPSWHLHRRLYDWVLSWAETPYGGIALFVLSLAESSCFPVPPDVLLAPLVLGDRTKWFRFALTCSVASVLGGILGYLIGFGAWEAVDNFFFDHVPGFTRDEVVTKGGASVECIILREGDAMRPWEIQLPTDEVEKIPSAELRDAPSAGEGDAAGEVASTQPSPVEKDIHYGTYSKVKQRYDQYNFWVVFTAGFTPIPYKVITITAGVFKINFVIFLIASTVSRSARFFMVAGLFWWFGPVIKPFIDKYFNLLCVIFVVLLVGGFAVLKYL